MEPLIEYLAGKNIWQVSAVCLHWNYLVRPHLRKKFQSLEYGSSVGFGNGNLRGRLDDFRENSYGGCRWEHGFGCKLERISLWRTLFLTTAFVVESDYRQLPISILDTVVCLTHSEQTTEMLASLTFYGDGMPWTTSGSLNWLLAQCLRLCKQPSKCVPIVLPSQLGSRLFTDSHLSLSFDCHEKVTIESQIYTPVLPMDFRAPFGHPMHCSRPPYNPLYFSEFKAKKSLQFSTEFCSGLIVWAENLPTQTYSLFVDEQLFASWNCDAKSTWRNCKLHAPDNAILLTWKDLFCPDGLQDFRDSRLELRFESDSEVSVAVAYRISNQG